MGFPSPSQAPSSPSPAQLLPDGWVSRSSILRTIHFWGISAQSFLQLCRNVWGIIRIRPGGYKPPNTFRMCHLYSKHLAPTLVKASYGQKTILGSTLTPTLRRRELKLCKSELSEVTHVQMADMWPEPGPSDPKASRLSSSANVSIPFLHPTDTCEGPGIHRVLLFHLNRVYRLHRNFCHHDPASKPYAFSVRIMSQGPKLLSSVPRLRERGCLMSSSQKRTQSLKLLPSEGIMNTPRTEWLHFSWQQKCESAKEQAQYMEEVLAGVKAYPELNPLGIRACWWSDSGSGERLPAGRRLRERANTLSIWLRYDTSQKLLPGVQRLSPQFCCVWKYHCLSKAGSLSSFSKLVY